MTGEEAIKKAAEFRGKGQFQDAIDVIDNNRSSFDDITLLPALMNGLYAAKELGDQEQAKRIAAEIAQIEPELPSIQEYL